MVDDFYTYDRIVLGCITCVILLFILFQVTRRAYLRHKFFSMHNGIHLLCFIWVVLRTCYFFMPDDANFDVTSSCGMVFIFYVPFSFQFSIFSMMLLFFARTFSSKRNWEKYVNFSMSKWWKNWISKKRNDNDMTNVNGANPSDLSSWRWSDGFLGDVTPIGNGSEEKGKLFHIKKKSWIAALYLLVNFLWLAFVVARCSFSCYFLNSSSSFLPVEVLYKVFELLTSLIFFLLMILLTIYGIKLAIKIKKDDLPMSFKMSNVSVGAIVFIIVVNTICFVLRGLYDIVLVSVSGLYEFFDVQHLRNTNYGKPILIGLFCVFEIIPILSVLFFFMKIVGAPPQKMSAKHIIQKNRVIAEKKNKRRKSLLNENNQKRKNSNVLDIPKSDKNSPKGSYGSTIGSMKRFQHIFDSNSRRNNDYGESSFLFGTTPSYLKPNGSNK